MLIQNHSIDREHMFILSHTDGFYVEHLFLLFPLVDDWKVLDKVTYGKPEE